MNQRGFTMIEMIIGLSILAVLGTTAGYGLVGGVKAFNDNSDVLVTLGKLRYASERMAREVREIRRDPANPNSYDITAMSSNVFSFIRGDGTMVSITANLPLLALAYDMPSGVWTLTDEVSSMSFSYYQGNGTTLATSTSDIAYVEFDLELSQAGNTYPQRTRVALRNQL